MVTIPTLSFKQSALTNVAGFKAFVHKQWCYWSLHAVINPLYQIEMGGKIAAFFGISIHFTA
jgi:hypothetical protein